MNKLLLCILILICVACPSPAADDALVNVEAEGSAVVAGDIVRAEDEALADAKRNAVEQAVGMFVKSEVVGVDYKIIRDSILTRSEGYIARWEKIDGSQRIEESAGGRMLRLRIRADVGLTELIDDMSDIEEVYNTLQRPRIAVRIDELNLGLQNTGLSSSALAVIRALKERGFDVVDDSSDDAEILLLGNAASYSAGTSSGPEQKSVAATARLDAKLVYAGTGDILFIPKSAEGRGVDPVSIEKAGRNALEDAGRRLITEDTDRFASQVLAEWALEVQNGRVYRLVIEGLSYRQFGALKKSVQGLRGTVGMVRETFRDETATLDVRSTLPADVFRERLMDLGIGGLRIVRTGGSVTGLAADGSGQALSDGEVFDYPPLMPPASRRRDDGRWFVTLRASGRD